MPYLLHVSGSPDRAACADTIKQMLKESPIYASAVASLASLDILCDADWPSTRASTGTGCVASGKQDTKGGAARARNAQLRNQGAQQSIFSHVAEHIQRLE
jgi:hypothetical protein